MRRTIASLVLGAGIAGLSLCAAAGAQTHRVTASLLPTARAIAVGETATGFATMINPSRFGQTAFGCSIAPPPGFSGDFRYQTTNAADNRLTGSPDTPADIASGGSQSFIFSLTPDSELDGEELALVFDCANTEPARLIPGVNTFELTAATSAPPDIIALASTLSRDGVAVSPLEGAGVFSMSAINIAAPGDILARPTDRGAGLPYRLQICETDSATGRCLNGRQDEVNVNFAAGQVRTFSVFAVGRGAPVPLDPAVFRVGVEFVDAEGRIVGAASVASQTDQQAQSRAGLAAGIFSAGQAQWNLALRDSVAPPNGFFDPDARLSNAFSFANSDFAFQDDLAVMGNYHGFLVFDIEQPDTPELLMSVVCPGGQGDVSLYGDLLFVSVEQNRARLDCGASGTSGQADPARFKGVRIFDISDLDAPRQIAAVQTCRGSHTHTVVPHPTNPGVIYIYSSGTGPVRSGFELAGCSSGAPQQNPATALYSIDVIEVPLAFPAQARLIDRPRIFRDPVSGRIDGLWPGGPAFDGAQNTYPTNLCHDITAYPELGLAAGACGGNGILLDISDPAAPVRIDDVFDPNMAFWHSASFTNDGDAVLFTDEFGGGGAAYCRPGDREEWGADILYRLEDDQLNPAGLFKLPAEQSFFENCVAHNGSLIPVPGRDILVQAWYSGGVSVLDFSDPDAPFEIAYFDRGPLSMSAFHTGGHWSAYWRKGRIFASDIVRGLDVMQLLPSIHLSQAELDAAVQVVQEIDNTQSQQRFVWPDTPVTARAYLDQLSRARALPRSLGRRAEAVIADWAENGPGSDLDHLAAEIEALETTGLDGERVAALAALLRRAAP